MKAIKEFLKPNWWKVGIFIVFSLFFVFLSVNCSSSFCDPPVECPVLPCSLWGLSLDEVVQKGIVEAIKNSYPSFSFFVLVVFVAFLEGVVLNYLSVCFVYFLVPKIKRLIIKTK